MKDAILDAEKRFDEVRQWSGTRKQVLTVRNLTDQLKEALSELEKQEIHKRKEGLFHKEV